MRKIIYPIILLFITISGCDIELDTERNFISTSSISGTWRHTNDMDSSILILSSSTMKEYIYERKTGKLIERIDYGIYDLFRISSPKGKFEDRHYISLKGYDDQEDRDSGDSYWSKFGMKTDTSLYIYRKTTLYKKIK